VADRKILAYLEILRREPAHWWSGICVESGVLRCPTQYREDIAIWRK